MTKLYYESSYGRILSHADRSDHKYAYKKMVNGKWRYYYDDDNKPDKGFSYKKMDKWKMENNIGISAPGIDNISTKNTSYSLAIKGVKDHQSVSKDVWDNGGTGLYYKNEPVKNIAKRTVSDIKKTASKQIDKGQRFVSGILNKAEKSIKNIKLRREKKQTQKAIKELENSKLKSLLDDDHDKLSISDFTWKHAPTKKEKKWLKKYVK